MNKLQKILAGIAAACLLFFGFVVVRLSAAPNDDSVKLQKISHENYAHLGKAAYKDAYPFKGGYALVAKGGKWGFVDKTGAEKNFNYDYMSEIPGKVYLLRKGGLFGFCDLTGREVSKFIYSECKGYESKPGGKYMYLMVDQHGEEIEVLESDLVK